MYALMQRTRFSFYWTCTVTHNSICVCSDIEIWTSGLLPEVKNNRKIQIIESSHGLLQEVVSHGGLTVCSMHQIVPDIHQIYLQEGQASHCQVQVY